jgi:F420-non-reducing hydrogenase iron-sulfur subunit
MVTEIRSPLFLERKKSSKAQVTVFHCFNALNNVIASDNEEYEVKAIKMPCSSLIREVFLLRAFEAGADMVMVIACPEGSCHYLEGNIRARKRVERVKKILDEIGLDGRRLEFYNLPQDGAFELDKAITKVLSNPGNLAQNKVA